MRSKLLVVMASILLASTYFGTGQARAAVSCGQTSVDNTFPGGVFVQRWCNNSLVGGVGTTIGAAQENLSDFTTLTPENKWCWASNSNPVGAFVGGYRVTFHCTDQYGGGFFVSGLGTTATDAGKNAFAFAEIYTVTDDVACSINDYDIRGFNGGYEVTTYCRRLGYGSAPISGIGTTATDAGINARGFSEILASEGITCLLSGNVELDGMLVKAVFSCGGNIVYGYGSTVTSAGNDALVNAGML